MILQLELMINRSMGLWRNLNDDGVKTYRRELQDYNKKINDFNFPCGDIIGMSNEQFKKLSNLLKQEIKFCDFYFEYKKRKGLHKWKFTKEEKRLPKYGWKKDIGNLWERSNGRMKALIEINKSERTTRVSLTYENDSETLEFYGGGSYSSNSKEIAHCNLRNEKNIENKIEEYKAWSKSDMKKYLYPYVPEKGSLEILNEILHIGDQ